PTNLSSAVVIAPKRPIAFRPARAPQWTYTDHRGASDERLVRRPPRRDRLPRLADLHPSAQRPTCPTPAAPSGPPHRTRHRPGPDPRRPDPQRLSAPRPGLRCRDKMTAMARVGSEIALIARTAELARLRELWNRS